jgi:hypothetical protein
MKENLGLGIVEGFFGPEWSWPSRVEQLTPDNSGNLAVGGNTIIPSTVTGSQGNGPNLGRRESYLHVYGFECHQTRGAELVPADPTTAHQ